MCMTSQFVTKLLDENGQFFKHGKQNLNNKHAKSKIIKDA